MFSSSNIRSLTRFACVLLAPLGMACSATSTLTDTSHVAVPLETIGDSTTSAAYRRDAYDLAIRQLRRDRAPSQQAIEIPAELVTSLYKALGAVFASKHPARDSVVVMRNIHVFPASRELLVGLDDSQPWTRAWPSGQQKTGNAAVDEILAKYELQVKWNGFSPNGFAQLTPGRVINVLPVAEALARIPGVRYAEQNGIGGDGGDITAYRTTAGWKLDYSYGSGDCPAGCIQRHYWTFEVSNDGRVEFVGSREDSKHPPRE
jgi:hypothetical protein